MAQTDKLPTKVVQCNSCQQPIVVHKWAPKLQVCDDCKSDSEQAAPPAIPQVKSEPRPVDKLRRLQDTLARLEFSISSHGHHKIYHDGESTIRLEPYCDKGTASDPNFTVEAFVVTRQEFIPITDPQLKAKIPAVALSDVAAILADVMLHNNQRAQHHIDMVRCSRCNELTSDWLMTGDNRIMCLAKCANIKPMMSANY